MQAGCRDESQPLGGEDEFGKPAGEGLGLDEFTNDVIVRVRPAVFAVFDTT